MNIESFAYEVKNTSIQLAALNSELKNNALLNIIKHMQNRKDEIIFENEKDIKLSEENNLSKPLLKRLKFDENKIQDVIDGIESLIKIDDPVGKTIMSKELDDNLKLYKVTCPIGVIGIIFESRPDALVQISTLCLKSGNGVLLKGGVEALYTNRILFDIISTATQEAGIPSGWIKLLETRNDVNEMLKMDNYIDLIIPRGSNEFVKYIMNNTNIPVMGHADGICHCYVDEFADIDMAVKVVVDSKTQYVAVCNATETLLVNKHIAERFLLKFKDEIKSKNVYLKGCNKTKDIIDVDEINDSDWQTEYLDYKLSIKIVDDLNHAIEHINKYGSGHTDSIITKNKDNASKFMTLVDSANVFLNCSTRFSDGFRYGFGAEVGISTGKIHARGPVGLEGLTIYKYKLIGNGDIVSDYVERKKQFKHIDINQKCPL